MNLRGPGIALLLLFVSFTLACTGIETRTGTEHTNLIVVMTDNQAPWTLGCYGNPEIRTPHIDRLAQDGVLFENAFSSNSVCSPARATFLTGLMPSQHGVHRWLRRGHAQIGPNAYNMINEFRTLPRILADAGYVCGLSGKWHLGDNLNPQEGFQFWVTKPHGHTDGFYNQPIIENGTVRREPSYQTRFWTDRGIEFIKKNRDKPFFLFLAYNGPYGLGDSMLRKARNRHAAYYADRSMNSFPRHQFHPWLVNNKQLINNIKAMRRYAAEISGIDDGVGRIMETLNNLGLEEHTLVVFTADQGLAGGHGGFWGMGDHTDPITARDKAMSIPLIFRHTGRIPGDRRSEWMVSNYDLMPTLLDYLGLERRVPDAPPRPGRSFAPLLRGQTLRWNRAVFYEFENVRAIRSKKWKYIHRYGEEPEELYNLREDPGEQNNLIGDGRHPDVRQRLRKRLQQFFNRYAKPQWDLWEGGASKTSLQKANLFGEDKQGVRPGSEELEDKNQ